MATCSGCSRMNALRRVNRWIDSKHSIMQFLITLPVAMLITTIGLGFHSVLGASLVFIVFIVLRSVD